MSLYEYNATVVRVVDGDTVDVLVDLGFKISHKIRIRVRGIDTAEIYGVKKNSEEHKKGMESKKFVEDLILNEQVLIVTYKDSKGKYGRYLADIETKKGSLAEILLERGLAKKAKY